MVRKGMRIQELTKRVGQVGRHGKVNDVRGDTVEVRWDDGHVSMLSGSLLVPDDVKKAPR